MKIITDLISDGDTRKQKPHDGKGDKLIKNSLLINEKWKQKKESHKQIQQEREAERRMKKHPEKEVVKGLVEGKKIVKVLGIIVSKQNWKTYLERMKQKIMSLTGYDLEQRLEMVQLACQWVKNSRNMGVRSVTLF